MTIKSVDLPHLRSVVLAGHAGAGKTTLGEQLLFKSGAVGRVGKVEDGSSHLDFEPEEQKRREIAEPRGRDVRDGRDARHDRRHARLPGLRVRGDLGLPGRRRRDPRHGRDGRGRGGPRAGRGARPVDRHGGVLLHQQVRQGERRPHGGARRAAVDVRQQDRTAPAGDRQGARLQRLRRPRPPQGVHVPGRQGGRGADPRRHGRRGRAPPGPAPRGGRRGRRRRADEVPRGRGGLRPGARGVPPQGRERVDSRARARRLARTAASGCRRCSTRSSATSPPRPTRARSPRSTRAAPRSRSRRIPTGRCWRASSRPRPTRSSAG